MRNRKNSASIERERERERESLGERVPAFTFIDFSEIK